MKKKYKSGLSEKRGVFGAISDCLSSLMSRIRDGIYSVSVKMHALLAGKRKGEKKKSTMSSKRKRELAFFIGLVAYPLLQFAVFYVGVNVNSVLLAFKKFDAETANYYFVGFENFKNVLYDLTHDSTIIRATLNSLKLYLCNLLIAMPLNLVFSYFLYKKVPGHGFFRVILFLPQIISTLVISLMFRYFVENGLSDIIGQNLLANISTGFNTIIFYCIWASFGTQILIFTGAMSGINPSLVEYGQLEGMNLFQEFIHVTLPLIFPTISIFLVSGIAGFFINQAGLFNFYGSSARPDLQTLGYIFFIRIVKANDAAYAQYPYASAAGLMFTCVAAPITLLVKYLLEKHGSSAD